MTIFVCLVNLHPVVLSSSGSETFLWMPCNRFSCQNLSPLSSTHCCAWYLSKNVNPHKKNKQTKQNPPSFARNTESMCSTLKWRQWNHVTVSSVIFSTKEWQQVTNSAHSFRSTSQTRVVSLVFDYSWTWQWTKCSTTVENGDGPSVWQQSKMALNEVFDYRWKWWWKS